MNAESSAAGEAQSVVVERLHRTLLIRLNRPEKRNAMTRAMSELIAAALDELDADRGLSIAVLAGMGTTFCAGMDLERFVAGETPSIPERGFGGLTERPPAKPIVAAVEGYALAGGFELVLASDLVIAGRSARFGLPEVKRGLVPRAGGLLRLPERIASALAMELILTGDPVSADRAAAIGLVNHIVDDGQACEAALKLAGRIAANGPMALAAAKRIVLESRDWPTAERFIRQATYTDPVFASDDAKEGARAFIERRAPVWTGR